MYKLKKVVGGVLALVMVFSSSFVTKAADVQSVSTQAMLQNYAEEMNVTIEEIVNYKENLNSAFDKLSSAVADEETGITTVQISENLYLQMESAAIDNGSTRSINTTISNSANVVNALGMTLIRMTAVATFNRSGTTVKPLEIYGLYDSTLYSVDCSDTRLGSAATTGSATVIFKCQFNVGVGDWVIPFFSANIGATIYCNYNGNPSSTWSGI